MSKNAQDRAYKKELKQSKYTIYLSDIKKHGIREALIIGILRVNPKIKNSEIVEITKISRNKVGSVVKYLKEKDVIDKNKNVIKRWKMAKYFVVCKFELLKKMKVLSLKSVLILEYAKIFEFRSFEEISKDLTIPRSTLERSLKELKSFFLISYHYTGVSKIKRVYNCDPSFKRTPSFSRKENTQQWDFKKHGYLLEQ